MPIKTSSLFERHLTEILDYYHQIDPALAHGFLVQLDAAKEQVSSFPHAHPKTNEQGIRKILMRQFPYRIRFKVTRPGHIIFLTIRHSARKE